MSIVVFNRKVSFEKPTIGARDYVSVSGAGWPESFPKKESDQKLVAFIGERSVGELVDNFAEHVELNCKGAASWTEVVKYLGRITGEDPDDISCEVAIAFWAHLVMKGDNRATTTATTKKGKKAC